MNSSIPPFNVWGNLLLPSISYLKLGLAHRFIQLFRQRDNLEDLVQVGIGYGSYWVPDVMSLKSKIAWCVGAGQNVDLDLYLAKKGMKITIVDPSESSIDFAKAKLSEFRDVKYIQKGIWEKTGSVSFFLPANPEHVSLSITNLQKTDAFVQLPVITLLDLSLELNEEPFLLKLDIEGAGAKVISNMLRDRIYPKILLVEFEQPSNLLYLGIQLLRLRKNKYRLIKVSGFDCVFVRNV